MEFERKHKRRMWKRKSDYTHEIEQYNKDGELVKSWKSIKDVPKDFRINGIIRCYRGKLKTYRGFVWKRSEKITIEGL